MKSQACSLQDLRRIGKILEDRERLKAQYAVLVRCVQPGTLSKWRGAHQLLQALDGKISLTKLRHVQPTHLYTIRQLRRKAPSEWPLWVERAEAAGRKAAKQDPPGKGWTVAELRKQLILAAKKKPEGSGKSEITAGDALEFLEGVAKGSVDLLLTDPPYMTDLQQNIHEFAARWVPSALSRLKATGRAYICTGAYPEELHAYLTTLRGIKDFALQQVLVWTYRNTLGPAPATDYKSNWQAIFYMRGPECLSLNCPVMTEQFSVQDIAAPDGRRGERLHAWQKPTELAERFIRHATLPGDLVLDPFAGSGTFLLAAAALGREGCGAERDPEMLSLCRKQGLTVIHAE